MIGDWMQFADGNKKCMVVGIKCDVRYLTDETTITVMDSSGRWFDKTIDELKPIPLTPEILEKNGFTECNVDDDGAVQYEFGFDDLGIDVWIAQPILLGAWRRWSDLKDPYSMINELPIRYVHELQHALCLCGIDKEIELNDL